jgi:large subunit ribosomal protein L23
MRAAQSIIKRPLLTEKGQRLRETGGAAVRPAEGEDYSQQIVFEVAKDANKIEIRGAVQTLFKVTVTDVRTLVVRGKDKRVGRFSGRRPDWKKAIVTLKAGDSISFFEGV